MKQADEPEHAQAFAKFVFVNTEMEFRILRLLLAYLFKIVKHGAEFKNYHGA